MSQPQESLINQGTTEDGVKIDNSYWSNVDHHGNAALNAEKHKLLVHMRVVGVIISLLYQLQNGASGGAFNGRDAHL